MKVRLKTIKQIKNEIRNESKWEYICGYICIKYKEYHWHIYSRQIKYFGNEIEVEKIKDIIDETHEDEFGNYYHESWFEPELEDFFKEEEFEI